MTYWLLLFFFEVVKCQEEILEKKKEYSSSVVILGVSIALCVIFAILGILIGIHFRVERIIRCCRHDDNELMTPPPTGVDNQAIMMTTTMNLQKQQKSCFTRDEGRELVTSLPAAFGATETSVTPEGIVKKQQQGARVVESRDVISAFGEATRIGDEDLLY